MSTAFSGLVRRIDFDLLTGGDLTAARELAIVPGGPMPGLFCDQPTRPAPPRRLLQTPSGHIQLDSTIDPPAYSYFIPGPRTAAHRAHISRRASDLAELLSPSARVLEIGAGDCALLEALYKVRPDLSLHAIDPGGSSCCPAISVSQRQLTDHAYTPASFDLIISEHCLEHSPHPMTDLSYIAALLAPHGWLDLEVPDIQAAATARHPITLSGIYGLHASYFTAKSLRFAVSRVGLAVSQIEPIDHYGHSLAGRFRFPAIPDRPVFSLPATPPPSLYRHFAELAAFGSMLPAGLPCWGASEHSLSNLAGLMSGGFDSLRLIDSNPAYSGKFPVGLSFQVESSAALAAPLNSVVILSPRSAQTILAENQASFTSTAEVYIPFFGRHRASDIRQHGLPCSA